jgi:hypothetical protein
MASIPGVGGTEDEEELEEVVDVEVSDGVM